TETEAPAPVAAAAPAPKPEATPAEPPAAATKKPPRKPVAIAVDGGDVQEADKIANQSIRVNVDTLEHLMTMVSELVLTRNQLLDLSKDPLTHMVRNSADQGLETPAERLAAGKGEQGTIRLSAYHEGGHIIICIADNGRGLNTERIKAKAVSNGLVSEAELEKMTEAQIHKFIFAPGFSTAAAITSVSGRGVGMAVVRTNIDQIGGTIEVKSVAGEGSSVTIKIPLTLAIVSALLVEAAGHRFPIPQVSVAA